MSTDTANKSGQGEDKKAGPSISEYLQTPRKKRKNFVIMALGPNFDKDVAHTIQKFVSGRYKGLAISQPKNAKDLKRQFGRNISLLIIDDQFDEIATVMELVESLKVKRRKETIPVLFMTEDPKRLVESYNTKLAGYHEVDDYCNFKKMEANQIVGKVKTGIEQQNRRKARRYHVNIDLTFFHLTHNKSFRGNFVDMSVQGALLKSDDLARFHIGDQLKINLPISRFLGVENGEFMSISARVRRIFIGGNLAGISFEYLSERQQFLLLQYVTSMVRYHLSYRG